MYTYKRLPYIILNNADDALVLEELFAADVYLHLLHVTLRRKAAAAVVFGHCVPPSSLRVLM